MATQTELDVLAKYSNDRLRRGTLTRYAKKTHLNDAYKMAGQDAERILDELYPVDNVNE